MKITSQTRVVAAGILVVCFVALTVFWFMTSAGAAAKEKRISGAASHSEARSITTADFDGDGAPDVVIGYAADDGTGIIDVRRGNPDAFAPTDDSVFARVQKRYNPEALLDEAKVLHAPEPVDLIAAGNFDSHNGGKDIIAAAIGGGRLFLFNGDGKGNFTGPKAIDLTVAVTALTTGEFRAADGRDDIVVGTSGRLLVFDGADGGVTGSPMEIAIPGKVRTVRLGGMDDDPFVDIIAATDSEIYILHGWGRKNTQAAESQLELVTSDIGVREMTIGHFVWDREARIEIAVESNDGVVSILGRRSIKTGPFSDSEKAVRSLGRSRPQTSERNPDIEAMNSWSLQDRTGWSNLKVMDASRSMSAKARSSLLATTNLFYRETQDILVAGDQTVSILRQVTDDVVAPKLAVENSIASSGDMAAFKVADAGAAVSAVLQLPQKLNGERNLLILREGSTEVEIVPFAPTNITVDRTDDPNGGALAAASVCGAGANDCSVRGAFQFANLPANAPATINLPAGTYVLATNGNSQVGCDSNTVGDLLTNQSSNIVGAGAATTIIRQTGTGLGNDGDRVMCMNTAFSPNLTWSFSAVTFTGGRDGSTTPVGTIIGGGGIIGGELDNNLTLTNVTFSNNQIAQFAISNNLGGGGLQITGGNLNVTNCDFGGTSAPGTYADRTSVNNANSNVGSGGGLAFTPSSPMHMGGTGVLTVTGSTFRRNTAAGIGGGGADLFIFAFGAPGGIGSGSANISTSTFSNNSATGSGGGIIVESLGLTLATTSITNNSATSGGGAYVGGANLVLNGTTPTITFSGNTATNGSGIGVNFGIDQNAMTNVRTINGGVTLQGTNTVLTGQDVFLAANGAWTNTAGSSLTFGNLIQDNGGNNCGACVNRLQAAFKANSTTTNIAGNWTMNGATFIGDSGTVNLAGNFAFTIAALAGDVQAGTSTVNFNGTGAQSLSNGASITFFNLTDSNTSQPLTLNNSFNVNGTFNANGASTILAPVAASVIGGTGTLTGTGTARVTRTAATAGFLDQYTMTNKTLTNLLVDYVGSAAQVLSSTTYGPLRINNSSGVTSAAGTATVNGLLTLQTGALAVGANTLVINNGTSVGTGSITSAVNGTVNYNQASGGQNVLAFNYGNLTFSNQNKVLASTGTIGVAGTFTPGAAVGHTITGSTINFNGTGAQSIPAFSYDNLTISGARTTNNVTLINAGTIFVAGTFNPTATFTSGNYVVTGNTINFNGGGAQTIPAFNYNNLTSSSTGSRTLVNGGTIGVAGAFAPGSNTYTITGNTINFNGTAAQTIPAFAYNNLTSSNSGARTFAGAGVISVASVFTPGTNAFTVTGSTVDFNGSGAQTIPAFNYNHLTSSNTGARTLANAGTIGVFGNFTPGGNVYTITGSTIDFNGTGSQNIPAFNFNNLTSSSTGARTLANSGTIGVAGSFTPGGNAYTTTGSTISYNGAAQSLAVFPYNNMSTAGSGIKSLTGATTIGGALTIGTGTTLDVTASNFALNLAGNWTNNGAFTAQSGTVTLNGVTPQTVGGTAPTTFFNLIINNANGALLAQNVNVNGLLTLTAGTFNIATNILTLNNGTSVGGGALNPSNGTTNYNQVANGQAVLAGQYNNITFSNSNKVLPNGGTIGISGVFTPGTAVGHTITGSTIDFNGSGPQTIPVFNYYNLTSSNTGARTLTSSGTIGIANIFTPGTNAYTITGSAINFNGSGAQTIPAFSYNNLTSSSTGARTLANSGVIRIAGVFTPGTNVYTITGSTVEYNGAALQTLPAAFPTYNNLTVNGTFGGTLAGNVAVNGTYAATTGVLNVGANTFTLNGAVSGTGTINSGATGTVNYNSGSNGQNILAGTYGHLTLSDFTKILPNPGTVNIAGVFMTGAAGGHTVTGSTVVFNGSVLQIIPAGFTQFNNLTISNPPGVNLASNITVDGTLNFITGTLNTGANMVSVGPAGTSSRTSGHVIGTLQKQFGGPGAFTYHVGTSGQYSPVDQTVVSGSGALSVKPNTGTAPAIPAFDPARMLQRYWTLNGTGTLTSNIVFHYLPLAPPTGDIPATSTESQYHIFRILGTGQAIRTPPDGIGILLDTMNHTFTVNGMNQYSDWTAGNPLAPTAANASVSGRVVDQNGRGVSGARVAMQDQAGNVVWAMTNPFGYYRFADLPTGQTYLIAPQHKWYEFQPRTIAVNDDLTGVDFVAEP